MADMKEKIISNSESQPAPKKQRKFPQKYDYDWWRWKYNRFLDVAHKIQSVNIGLLSVWGKRHTFTLMSFLGFASVHNMRINLSVAIVGMVNSSEKIIVRFMASSSSYTTRLFHSSVVLVKQHIRCQRAMRTWLARARSRSKTFVKLL